MRSPPPPFQALLDTHARPLHRFLVAAVGAHDAADAFQETMLAALRAYPTLPHHDNLRGWLFTIAHRKVIDAARAGDRRPLPVAVPAGGIERFPGPGDDDLWVAVQDLPPKQRTAVVLRHVAGWSYADVAGVLGCSDDAARQSVKAGLDKLRATVEVDP